TEFVRAKLGISRQCQVDRFRRGESRRPAFLPRHRLRPGLGTVRAPDPAERKANREEKRTSTCKTAPRRASSDLLVFAVNLTACPLKIQVDLRGCKKFKRLAS